LIDAKTTGRVLAALLSLASTGCTLAGLGLGVTMDQSRSVTPTQLRAQRGSPLEVKVTTSRRPDGLVPRPTAAHADFFITGALAERRSGSFIVRDDKGVLHEVRFEHIQGVDILARPPPEYRVRVGVAARNLADEPRAAGDAFVVEGTAWPALDHDDRFVVKNPAGTWVVRNSDVRSIHVYGGSAWLEGMLAGALVDGVLVVLFVAGTSHNFFGTAGLEGGR
jgi:hypothetical protein